MLHDPYIGAYDVTQVIDRPQHEVNRVLESFFLDRSRDDLLLLHFSCHGIKDDNGHLYFAAKDTDHRLLASTAVSAAFVHDQMRNCRARSIVVLLDCCYSGAFLPGTKGDTAVHVREELAGHGRAILTATNRTEYAWEGDHLTALAPEPSRFTGAIINGLQTGEADRDQDGIVSVNDLYEYVYERVLAAGVSQRPQLWTETEYRVAIAHITNGRSKQSARLAMPTEEIVPEPLAEHHGNAARETRTVQPAGRDERPLQAPPLLRVQQAVAGREFHEAGMAAVANTTDGTVLRGPSASPTVTHPAEAPSGELQDLSPHTEQGRLTGAVTYALPTLDLLARGDPVPACRADNNAPPSAPAQQPEPLVFRGYTATVTLCADRAEIRRKFVGKVGGAKDCVIPIAEVAEVQSKEPTRLVNGYVHLVTAQDRRQFRIADGAAQTRLMAGNSHTVLFSWNQRETYAAYLAVVTARVHGQAGNHVG